MSAPDPRLVPPAKASKVCAWKYGPDEICGRTATTRGPDGEPLCKEHSEQAYDILMRED